MAAASPPETVAPAASPTVILRDFAGWCARNPAAVLLVAGILAALVYFFGFHEVFTNGTRSTAHWAWEAWNPENNQEHSVLILPIALFLLWYHRDKLAAARKEPSLAGLAIVLIGACAFVLAARALQPRLAIVALPILIYGSVLYLWGRQVARVFLFPCAFLLFMVPIGGLVQGTVSLQLLVSNVVNVMAGWIGVKIEASGTTIRSLDGSFNFEIAEGCSGVRSLMAMTTLTALYAHFTQTVLWKKVALFSGSVAFAVVGNIGRIFTVILVAKFYDPKFASGLYHDYSGFVFFPIAVVAMVSFGNLLNTTWRSLYEKYYLGEKGMALEAARAAEGKTPAPISYDY